MTPYYQRDELTIYCAPFRDVMAELEPASAAAIVTDPPYPRSFLPLWFDLARCSEVVLERGGSLLSLVPHYALPEILATVGQFLKYRWTHAMIQQSGSHRRMAMGIEVTWKPLCWWVKGAWPARRGFRVDSFASDHLTGRQRVHKWQQSDAWAEFCLRFVPAGGLVVDPMMGAGTTALACRARGLPFIGIDIDEAACELAVKRLEGGSSNGHDDADSAAAVHGGPQPPGNAPDRVD